MQLVVAVLLTGVLAGVALGKPPLSRSDHGDGDEEIPKVSKSDVTFYLYTRKNRDNAHVIKNCDVHQLLGAPVYDRKKANVLVIHGWMNKHSSEVNVLIKAALLVRHDINVFVVDWSGPASTVYSSARKAVSQVGTVVGDFVTEAISRAKLSASGFALVGHSLGAHVAGCAGARIAKVKGKVHHIVGLDPAGPGFTVENKDNRLDPGDADFVQVLHSNGAKLGFRSSSGHADYYPNGGDAQPGCGVDAAGTCSHPRSYKYYAESVENPKFHAWRCASYKDFENGLCKSNPTTLMGGYPVDKRARGNYFLKTAAKKPFALGK